VYVYAVLETTSGVPVCQIDWPLAVYLSIFSNYMCKGGNGHIYHVAIRGFSVLNQVVYYLHTFLPIPASQFSLFANNSTIMVCPYDGVWRGFLFCCTLILSSFRWRLKQFCFLLRTQEPISWRLCNSIQSQLCL